MTGALPNDCSLPARGSSSRKIQVPKPFRHRIVLLILAALLAAVPAAAATSLEYQVKAAYLYNFLKFVDWSRIEPGGNSSPFEVCIVGEDLFGPNLDALAQRTAKGRPVKLKRLSLPTEFGNCHVLFVNESDDDKLRQIFDMLQDRDVLTVGQSDNFLELGGTVRFLVEQNRVLIELNLEAARRVGLKLHAKLIEVSRIYQPDAGNCAGDSPC